VKPQFFYAAQAPGENFYATLAALALILLIFQAKNFDMNKIQYKV
jgi:hypothetical protein